MEDLNKNFHPDIRVGNIEVRWIQNNNSVNISLWSLPRLLLATACMKKQCVCFNKTAHRSQYVCCEQIITHNLSVALEELHSSARALQGFDLSFTLITVIR